MLDEKRIRELEDKLLAVHKEVRLYKHEVFMFRQAVNKITEQFETLKKSLGVSNNG